MDWPQARASHFNGSKYDLETTVVYKSGRFFNLSTQCLWEHKPIKAIWEPVVGFAQVATGVYPQNSSEGKGKILAQRW